MLSPLQALEDLKISAIAPNIFYRDKKRRSLLIYLFEEFLFKDELTKLSHLCQTIFTGALVEMRSRFLHWNDSGAATTVIQTLTRLLTFEEFLDWKPENGRYELHDGVIIEMQPTGKHEEISGFLSTELVLEFRRLQLPYFMPKQALVKAPGREAGYLPDVFAVNRNALANEPFWEKSSTLTCGTSIPLVIEVVSTNWRDDYLTKLRDYEEIGIPEYWIVDYLGLGGSRYIGSPKQPTISIYQLVDGEYQVRQFRGNNRLESPTLRELDLTALQVFRGER